MQENWYALALALLSERFITIELAFMYLDAGERPKTGVGRNGRMFGFLTDDDTKDMIELHKELSCKAIGDIYGVSKWAVNMRLRKKGTG